MKLKTVQWNIGGGKLLQEDTDPTLLNSYQEDGIDKIIAFLREQDADIITLQETHAAHGTSQVETIANALGYPGWVNDEYADSHIEAGQRLGQGIISRFELKDHTFEWFTNPNLEITWEDGSIAKSHDKGRTRCSVSVEGHDLIIQTFHAVPYRRFHVTPDSDLAKKILADIASKLSVDGPGLIQADFNLSVESLRDFMPELFKEGFEEIIQAVPTSCRGHHSDHVLYRGLALRNHETINHVTTDHYPIVSEFEVN